MGGGEGDGLLKSKIQPPMPPPPAPSNAPKLPKGPNDSQGRETGGGVKCLVRKGWGGGGGEEMGLQGVGDNNTRVTHYNWGTTNKNVSGLAAAGK